MISKVDFLNILEEYPDMLGSSSRLKNYLTDLFPDETLCIRLIMLVYSSELWVELYKKEVSHLEITRLEKKLVKEYGISEKNANYAISIWNEDSPDVHVEEEYEWKNQFSNEAYEVAVNKPPYWEYLLYFICIRDLWKDVLEDSLIKKYKEMIKNDNNENKVVLKFMVLSKMLNIKVALIHNSLNKLLTADAVRAFGEPGEEGNADLITVFADNVIQIYKEIIDIYGSCLAVYYSDSKLYKIFIDAINCLVEGFETFFMEMDVKIKSLYENSNKYEMLAEPIDEPEILPIQAVDNYSEKLAACTKAVEIYNPVMEFFTGNLSLEEAMKEIDN